jgi:hypothetical protein
MAGAGVDARGPRIGRWFARKRAGTGGNDENPPESWRERRIHSECVETTGGLAKRNTRREEAMRSYLYDDVMPEVGRVLARAKMVRVLGPAEQALEELREAHGRRLRTLARETVRMHCDLAERGVPCAERERIVDAWWEQHRPPPLPPRPGRGQ